MKDTKWCVITGAPCSGKTSVLLELEKLNFQWKPEIARIYIEQELAKGRLLTDIRSNEGEFQRGLIEAKLKVESEADSKEIIFFDRAMPDSVTYYRAGNLNPNDVLSASFSFKYNKVFIFDRLDYVLDEARIEDKKTAEFLDKWLELDYKSLGYDTVRVPVMSIQERVNFILDKIK